MYICREKEEEDENDIDENAEKEELCVCAWIPFDW